MDLSEVAVAVTRPREQSLDLARLIERHGGTALLYPLIAIAAASDGDALRRAAAQDVDALVFTSVNGVRAYLSGRAAARAANSSPPEGAAERAAGDRANPSAERATAGASLDLTGRDPRETHPPAICVGSQTAAAAQAAGITVLAIPTAFASDQLARTVASAGMAKQRMLLVRGNLADERLACALRKLGCDVTEAVGYRTTEAPEEARRLMEDLLAGRVHVLTFASGSAVNAFARALGGAPLPAGALVASIGPKTTAALAHHGIRVDMTAAKATGEGLVDALRDFLKTKAP
ncbi:MAG: uroporphyrinogen-III synthase [Bacilli bacterium]